ncbi:hypothetical protein NS14008_36110 [Nocardia seriolae]|nr:hypothetical protein NS14008_36110 [Nocardia seriolae]
MSSMFLPISSPLHANIHLEPAGPVDLETAAGFQYVLQRLITASARTFRFVYYKFRIFDT